MKAQNIIKRNSFYILLKLLLFFIVFVNKTNQAPRDKTVLCKKYPTFCAYNEN